MTTEPWQDVVARFEQACRSAGLDLVHAFCASDYNQHVAREDSVPTFGRERALAILVGNTRALWPAFMAACRQDPALAQAAHPLDSYATSAVEHAIARATQLAHHSRFSHVTAPRALPIQRAAELSGLAALSPSHLVLHPQHGPWLALRALVIVDCEGPASPAPPPPRPCASCSQPCVPALERAVAASGPELSLSTVSAHAADWIAVRSVCPVGQASRYGEQQLRYHYGLDRRLPVQGS